MTSSSWRFSLGPLQPKAGAQPTSQEAVPYAQAEGMAKAFVVAGSVSSEAENMSQRDKHRDTYKATILPVLDK